MNEHQLNISIWIPLVNLSAYMFTLLKQIITHKCSSTSSPSLFWTRKTSLHSWMPDVSGSDPPLQENPVRGSSSLPIHFSSSWYRNANFTFKPPSQQSQGLQVKLRCYSLSHNLNYEWRSQLFWIIYITNKYPVECKVFSDWKMSY